MGSFYCESENKNGNKKKSSSAWSFCSTFAVWCFFFYKGTIHILFILKWNVIFSSMKKQFRNSEMKRKNVFNHLKAQRISIIWTTLSYKSIHPFTLELFLPGCRGSWEDAGSRGSAGWSASWLEAAPAGAGPEDGEAALAFNVFWRLDT